jgi:hypothetical protein
MLNRKLSLLGWTAVLLFFTAQVVAAATTTAAAEAGEAKVPEDVTNTVRTLIKLTGQQRRGTVQQGARVGPEGVPPHDHVERHHREDREQKAPVQGVHYRYNLLF